MRPATAASAEQLIVCRSTPAQFLCSDRVVLIGNWQASALAHEDVTEAFQPHRCMAFELYAEHARGSYQAAPKYLTSDADGHQVGAHAPI